MIYYMSVSALRCLFCRLLADWLYCPESSILISLRKWVDWVVSHLAALIFLFVCLLNVKGLIVFKEATASAAASCCASLFFRAVWSLNSPGVTAKLCQVLNNQLLLRERLATAWRSEICLLSEYQTPTSSRYSNFWSEGWQEGWCWHRGHSMPLRDFIQA